MSGATGCARATRLASSPRDERLARVLVVHNHYQLAGGEDQVFRAEVELLRQRGHAVRQFTVDNRTITAGLNPTVALETIWSRRSARALAKILREFRPDITHFHNTFPLISPSAYYVCRAAQVGVVQTLHNYRLGCPKATLYRDGHICEDCLGKTLAVSGAVHGCYRASRAATAVVALMNATHRLVGTWRSVVDSYIALSEFQRSKLIGAGLPAAKIAVKGNFVDPDPGPSDQHLPHMVFVGRLTPEKGVITLLDAWRYLHNRVSLKIIGDGPLAGDVAEAVRGVGGIEWLGARPVAETHALIGRAAAIIVPSAWHEPFGLVAIEAFARGTPVIAARSGALTEIVQEQRSGLTFSPGSATELAALVDWAATHPVEIANLGRGARRAFERSYTAERNYAVLASIYADTLRAVSTHAKSGPRSQIAHPTRELPPSG